MSKSSHSTSSGVRVGRLDPEHRQHGAVEALGGGEVRDRDPEVVEHGSEATVAGMLELDTPDGPTRAHLHEPGARRAARACHGEACERG